MSSGSRSSAGVAVPVIVDDDRDEDQLIADCQSLQPSANAAFQILVQRYEPRVYRTCVTMLRNRADAEDVTQEIFIKVFRKLHAFERRSSFSSWLFAIARNECLSAIAKAKSSRLYRAESIDSADMPSFATGLAEAVESQDLLNRVLERLKPEERDILVSRFVSELAIDDIASLHQISLSAAKMRLYRAIDRFALLADTLSDSPVKQDSVSD